MAKEVLGDVVRGSWEMLQGGLFRYGKGVLGDVVRGSWEMC